MTLAHRQSLSELLSKRLLFVTGKGGVGKSTCALAMAWSAAKENKRVLFCEFGARPASADYLEAGDIGHTPSVPLPDKNPNLWVARLDAHLALKEYFAEILKVGALVNLATENKVLSRLWKITPSVDEIVLLSAIMNLERGTHSSGLPPFDLIVVDMAATGHAQAMLGVPKGILGLGKAGPLGKRCAELEEMLGDSKKTAFCIVSLPEELPVNESIQLSRDLASQLGLHAGHVIINSVQPTAFSQEQRALMGTLEKTTQSPAAKSLLHLARDESVRQQRQMIRTQELRNGIDAEFTEIEHVPNRGRDLIERIATQMGDALEAIA